MAEIFLVRHAQAGADLNNYDQLSELGTVQATLLGEYLSARDVSFDHVYLGTLNRHAQTFEALPDALHRDVEIRKDDGLNEYQFREILNAYAHLEPDDPTLRKLQATNYQHRGLFYQVIEAALRLWTRDELGNDLTESWLSFNQRVNDAFSIALTRCGKSEKVLIISSGGPIAVLLKRILHLDDEHTIKLNLQIKNTSVCHCYYDQKDIELSGFNGLAHLDTDEHYKKITLS